MLLQMNCSSGKQFIMEMLNWVGFAVTHYLCAEYYEGRPINKLQNGIILLIFII